MDWIAWMGLDWTDLIKWIGLHEFHGLGCTELGATGAWIGLGWVDWIGWMDWVALIEWLWLDWIVWFEWMAWIALKCDEWIG